MCAIDDVDPCTWLGTETRRARKPYRCEECGRQIAIGEAYAYSRFIAAGDMVQNKACAHCDAARKWLSKHCGGWVTGELAEDLNEHWPAYNVDGLPRLVVGMRRQWKGRGGRGLMPLPRDIATDAKGMPSER